MWNLINTASRPGACVWISGMVALLVISCGAPHTPARRTVASTAFDAKADSKDAHETDSPPGESDDSSPGESADSSPAPRDLKDRMVEDGRTAAIILLKAACEEKSDIGTLAAVYARRVGLRAEPNCEKAALLRGVASKSPLVRALSWRHLIERIDIAPLPVSDLNQDDPAVRVPAALAFAVRNLPVPSELASVFRLPPSVTCTTDDRPDVDRRLLELKAAAWPFDDGLVAASVAFVESVYAESCEISNGKPRWSAERLRQSLFAFFRIAEVPLTDDVPLRQKTRLDEALDNPLVKQTEAELTAIALSAAPNLRIEALRAEIIRGGAPTAERLAAAAGALSSSDAALRIEGARSFLLLIRQMLK